jgi:Ca-activated chloride channel homolog
MTKILLTLLMISFFLSSFSQNERSLARKGNKLYESNKFVDAEVNYKKSLTKKPDFTQASFNLGDAYYKQKRYDEAAKQYDFTANLTKNKSLVANSYHNLGNAYLESYKTENDQQKKMQFVDKSIEAYKNSLKINPKDQDTKYNLSYAMNLKKLMQQNKQQQNQQKQDNKQQDQKKQDQQKKEQKKEEQKQQQKPEKQELTREEAEKLLQAIQSQEKDVQERLNKKEAVPVKVKIEKEW